MISTYGVPCVHDAQAGAVLLVLAVHHHPVAGVAVHAVLHCRVQVLVNLPDNWVNYFLIHVELCFLFTQGFLFKASLFRN